MLRTLALCAALSGLAAPAIAQDAGRAACFADAKVVCPKELADHDRAAVRACLVKNIDKTSPACRAFIKQSAPPPKAP
jgi:hypothetical protein